MIEGVLGSLPVGDSRPVRLMGIINLSRESFYKGSVAGPGEALSLARRMQEEGADAVDLGAVSTAPGSPFVSEDLERERLFPALKEVLEGLDGLDIAVSVDTQRAAIAEEALSLGAGCINDVSGLSDPAMPASIANHGGSLIIMATARRPGDLLFMDQIIPLLGEKVRAAQQAGVDPSRISVDPGIGKWVPEKAPLHDLAILDGLPRLRVLGRPVVAAVSRKSFIGEVLAQPDPFQRLEGTLAATAIAVHLGAHIVRTHDVAASRNTIKMASAIRGRLSCSRDEEMEVEVLDGLGFSQDLGEVLRRTGVDELGFPALCKKGSFRILAAHNLSSMEALIVKQEMLSRGGDAAIPRLALRCDPHPQEVLILGTAHQIAGLVKNLKGQPFRLSQLAGLIQEALQMEESPERYRVGRRP